MTTRTDDLVGYTFRADNYCPECIVHQLAEYVPVGTVLSTEGCLDELASDRGIDRQDERSFDSGEFPKVIFRDQLTTVSVYANEDARLRDDPDEVSPDRCGACGKVLGS